jgi:peptidoglycan/xylan/chitin deacetylase (PgdA/CDA1 family)
MESLIWPEGKTAAVTMCYDGGSAEHLNEAKPLLEAMGVRGTFFLCPTLLLDDPVGWKAAQDNGHELGSHSLYNVTDHGALFTWTRTMVGDDLDLTNDLFRELFGAVPRSFALPGWSTHSLDGDYLETVKERFTYVRSDRRESNDPQHHDPKFLGSFPLDMRDEDLAVALAVTIRQGGWAVLRCGALTLDHEKMLRSLCWRPDVWVAPLQTVGDWVSPRNRAAMLR